MTYTTLQWMAPELARGGFLSNEAWVEEHAAAAVALFPNQGLHAAATLMASVHPAGLDYIKQAPVLAVAAAYGRSLHRQQERLFVARHWGSVCRRGPKLRDMMATFKVAYQLRALDGYALCPSRWAVLQLLSEIPPSSLAQMIPAGAGPQAQWLRRLGAWLVHLEQRGWRSDRRFAFEWIARVSAGSVRTDLTGIGDFIFTNRNQFNAKWSLARAVELTETWHRDLAKRTNEEAFFKSHGIGFSDPIDYRPLPNDPTSIAGFEIIPLRSGEELFAEGALMHHCVSSYSGAVVTGQSRIFSVRKDGSRVATFELARLAGKKYGLTQLKGPCNAAPAAGVRDAVAKFITSAEAA
jgi:hypothetical protein